MTSSVTGCSTCSRVFISMKKNSSGASSDDEELDGPRADVVRRSRAAAQAAAPMRARVAASSSGDGASSMTFWCRRCSEHSRSPRWMTCAVRVGQHLHLDVPRALDEPLEQQRVVAERRRGHAAGGGERVGQLVGARDDLHALAAAARRRLDQQREARLRGRRGDLGVGHPGRAEPGIDRHPGARDVLLRADLVAHDLERALDPGR